MGPERAKKFIVLANWKMNKTLGQGIAYVRALNQGFQGFDSPVEIILCVPFTVLAAVSKEVRGSRVSVGAQNVHDEPIWAIGNGKIATTDQAEEAHQFIRQRVGKLFSKETARMIRIVYGGSVKWNNVSAMLRAKDIDGVGVGSDSLDVQSFLRIVQSCCRAAID